MQPITTQDYLTKDFFELVGLASLSNEQKEALLVKMNQTVLARVFSHVYEQLGESERVELDAISVGNILPFLKDRGFDTTVMIVEEALRYRMELVAMMEAATDGLTEVPNPAEA